MKERNWFSRAIRTLFGVVAGGVMSVALLAQGGVWITKAPMPTPHTCLGGGTIRGTLYVIGGVKRDPSPPSWTGMLQAYHPNTNSWTTQTPVPTPRCNYAVASVNGILYAIGGSSFSSDFVGTVEAYDPVTNSWSTMAPMTTPRTALAAVAVNNLIYAIGGINGTGVLGTVEAYDPQSDTWTPKPPMPTPRYSLSAIDWEGLVYAVGGDNTRDGPLPTVEAYDPRANSWSSQPAMPTCRAALATAVVDGILYGLAGYTAIVGGNPCAGGFAGSLAKVERFDPVARRWSLGISMPTPRNGPVAGVVADTIYVVGGGADGRLGVNEAFSPFLSVPIDIKPGDPNNTINLKSNADVTVAILGSATLGTANIDPATVRFAGASAATKGNGSPKFSLSDVNRDGFIDLLVDFRARDLQLAATDSEAVLKATTFAGQRIRGVDAVRVLH